MLLSKGKIALLPWVPGANRNLLQREKKSLLPKKKTTEEKVTPKTTEKTTVTHSSKTTALQHPPSLWLFLPSLICFLFLPFPPRLTPFYCLFLFLIWFFCLFFECSFSERGCLPVRKNIFQPHQNCFQTLRWRLQVMILCKPHRVFSILWVGHFPKPFCSFLGPSVSVWLAIICLFCVLFVSGKADRTNLQDMSAGSQLCVNSTLSWREGGCWGRALLDCAKALPSWPCMSTGPVCARWLRSRGPSGDSDPDPDHYFAE